MPTIFGTSNEEDDCDLLARVLPLRKPANSTYELASDNCFFTVDDMKVFGREYLLCLGEQDLGVPIESLFLLCECQALQDKIEFR